MHDAILSPVQTSLTYHVENSVRKRCLCRFSSRRRRRWPPRSLLSLRLEYFNTNSFAPNGHSTIGSVAAADGIADGDAASEERTDTSVGLSPSPAPLPPPFLPKTTPNMTARATIGAVMRTMRVPRRSHSLDVAVAASASAIYLTVVSLFTFVLSLFDHCSYAAATTWCMFLVFCFQQV